jgi:hypothetical protein
VPNILSAGAYTVCTASCFSFLLRWNAPPIGGWPRSLDDAALGAVAYCCGETGWMFEMYRAVQSNCQDMHMYMTCLTFGNVMYQDPGLKEVHVMPVLLW